jgi:hypothetical protein
VEEGASYPGDQLRAVKGVDGLSGIGWTRVHNNICTSICNTQDMKFK